MVKMSRKTFLLPLFGAGICECALLTYLQMFLQFTCVASWPMGFPFGPALLFVLLLFIVLLVIPSIPLLHTDYPFFFLHNFDNLCLSRNLSIVFFLILLRANGNVPSSIYNLII